MARPEISSPKADLEGSTPAEVRQGCIFNLTMFMTGVVVTGGSLIFGYEGGSIPLAIFGGALGLSSMAAGIGTFPATWRIRRASKSSYMEEE